MANLYLQLLQNSKSLPDQYRMMGTRSNSWTDTSNDIAVQGWLVCQRAYKMNEDGRDWWSNDESVVVDGEGALWNLSLSEQFDAYPSPGALQSFVRLAPVTGENLRAWHATNPASFAILQKAIEAMI